MTYQYQGKVPVRGDFANEGQFSEAMKRYERTKANTVGVMNWWNDNIAPAFALNNGVKTRAPMTNWNTDLSGDRHQTNDKAVLADTKKKGSGMSNLPADYKKTEQEAGETADKHRRGAGFSSFTPPENNPGETLDGGNGGGGGKADPYPTTLDEAYGAMRPEAYGMTRLGMQMGNLNTKGFAEPTDGQTLMINQSWSVPENTDLGVDYTPGIANVRDKSAYNLEDAGTDPVAWTHDAGDLGIEPVLVKDSKADGLAGLRSGEKDAGLVYASGKYWAENDSGKLEAIETDLVNGEGTAREQAFAFMESKKQKVKDSPPTPAEAQEPTQTKDTKKGDGTKETPTPPPATTQTPPSTKQTPSSPLGEVPTDFGGIKLPGGISQMVDTAYDYGEGLAGDAGAWYGEKKGRKTVGNAPVLGDIFGEIGKKTGRDRGTKLYGETLGPLRDYFQQ